MLDAQRTNTMFCFITALKPSGIRFITPLPQHQTQDLVCSENSSLAKQSAATSGSLADDEMLARQVEGVQDEFEWPPARERDAHRKEQISAVNKKQVSDNCTQNMHAQDRTFIGTSNQTRDRLDNFDRLSKLILVIITFLYLLAGCSLQPGAAQCPWTRDAVELHSDCICDFNPSLTTNLEQEQRPINRMSVQCSPVNFQQLLRALKQTASIELPNQLISAGPQHESLSLEDRSEDFRLAAAQLVSQAKLDLLHVSNSSIGRLVDNTFIINTANFAQASSANGSSVAPATESSVAGPLDGRHLVVAIQSLHLSRCAIEEIQAGAFNGLEWSLTSLSLSDNQLELVPSEALQRLVNLRVLDLSNNRLFKLQANSFKNLAKLNTLRLADNRLGQPQSESNVSRTIDSAAFSGLEASLTDLNLKNTHLEVFPVAIKDLRHLAFLNLAQNQISHIPPKSFESTQSLTAINLERNRISRLEEDTFLGIERSLSSLSLLGNLLESFPAQQLANLSSLRRLDIGFNRIESLPANAFVSNKQLILIALDGNPLETLPEAAFKPLEGTLRGMSVGGKSLNCDCRLSWMLRWQQEFHIQISSREREPQFCSKPHYLRSLVSFAALKPEHLTCSSGTSPPQVTTSYVSILPRNYTSTGWTVNTNEPGNPNTVIRTNQQAATAYFTLPVQFEPTLAASTRTPGGSGLSGLWLARTESVQPIYTTGFATTNPTTEEPVATTTMNSSMLAPTSTSLVDAEDDVAEQSGSSMSTTYLPEETTAASFGQTSTDLIEAATNSEPSSRENDITVTSETTLPRYWTSPAAHNRSATFGVRTSLGASGATPNSADLPVVDSTVSNLPEDELFVTDSSKKQSRHGFLPAMRPKQPPVSVPLDATLRRWTENITTISSPSNHRHQSQEAPSDRRRPHHDNRMHPTNAEQSTKPVQAAGSRQTSKPIVHSVFGTRAGDNSANQNGQRRDRNGAASRAGHHVHNGPASVVANVAGNNHSMVPAIPTTINVYRTSHQLYNQSSQSSQSLSGTSSRQALSHLLKGARFVDEQLQTGSPPASVTRTTNRQVLPQSSVHHSRAFTTMSSLDAAPSRVADPDIERYTLAASNHIQARVSPSSAGSSSASASASRSSEESTAPSAAANQLNDIHLLRSSPPNNTRMSVSSIYRLATSSQPPRPTSTTTPPPTTTTSAPPQTSDGTTAIIEAPIDSINAARRHFNQYGHLVRTTTNPDARRTSPFNVSALTETALSAQDNVLTKLFSNRVSWRNSTAAPATTTTTSTTTTSTTTTTTRPPELSTSQSGSDGNGTTTRMAATVRFVESSQPALRQPAAGAVAANSSVSTTTPKPFSVAVQTDDMAETRFATTQLVTSPTRFAGFHGSVSDQNSAINTSGLLSAASVSPADSLGSSSSPSELNTERIGARTVTSSIRKDQRALQTDQPQVVVSHLRPLQEQLPAQGDRGSAFLEVGEQRHEARITISGGTGKHSSGHSMIAVGSASQPVERASTINLVTKESFVPRQTRDESSASNSSTVSGPPQAGGNPLHPGVHSARFFAKLAKMADFDQLALILAGLLCLFILILALTIVCICYSSWSARRRKNGVASRLSSFSSSASGSGSNQQRQMVQSATFGGAPISHRSAPGRAGFITRILCCCFSEPKLKRQTKRRAPTSSLALHDDDHSSGGSSQGLKTSGKSMLLANSQTTLSNQDLLFESIRRASMRLARVQNQLTSKPLAYGEKDRRTKRRRSYCEQSSRDQPIDHEASIQRHLEAHQLDQEYFVGLAAAARTAGRRRSTTMGALGMEASLENVRTNQRAGLRAEHAPDDWIRDDTLSSCDSDKSCSPGANRNNRYNISEAHRAYLGSKNANQIQASMFVTTSGNQKSGLLKTIDAHQNQRDPHLDYFDRDSRLSSDKSTTDDSRAPLNQTARRHEYKTNRSAYLPQTAPIAPQSTLRTTTTRSFGMPVARSRSIGRLQEYPPASNFKSNHAQALASNGRGNNSADDYLISDLIPISAEEQWPEPYVDPADELPMMALGSKERVMFAQSRPDASYPQQLIRSQVTSQFAPTGPRQIGSSCNEDTQRRAQTHRRTASGHRAYDDAYLANWHTMSRGAKRAVPFGHSGEQQSAEAVAGGHPPGRTQVDHDRAHEENNSQFPGSLVRYRSIPSLSGLQPVQGQQVFNGQLTGATNWLRWTPSSFVSQELGTRDNTTVRHHSESPLQATGSSTNAPRSANRSSAEQSARNWHRDNHVESVYVAASQQR